MDEYVSHDIASNLFEQASIHNLVVPLGQFIRRLAEGAQAAFHS